MKAKRTTKPRRISAPPLLQKQHRNDIYRAIEAVNLDPAHFKLNDSGTEVRIKYRWSQSCFIVRRESSHYLGRSVVGDGVDWPYSPSSWQSLMPRISRWLEEVKRDLDTPDLWAELQRDTKLFGAASNELIENKWFTPNEQKEIAERLKKVVKSVSDTHSLSKAQIEALEEKVDYLVDASTRLGRKDWLSAFIGAIFGFVLTAALPPESARTIFTTFLRGIGLIYPELPLLE